MYPETLGLLITTHGEMPVEEGKVGDFVVPKGMCIVKVAAVAPGVCNITSELFVHRAMNYLKNVFKRSPDMSDDIIFKTAITLNHLHYAIAKNLDIDLKKGILEKEDVSSFLRSSDRMYSIRSYDEGDRLVDKIYTNEPGPDKVYDLKINAINVPGNPDLMNFERTVAKTRRDSKMNSYTQLSDIIEFVQENSVKNVILFDLSCSTIYADDDRTGRLIGRQMWKEGINGGKKKTRKQKTKRRRTYRRRA